MLCIDTKTSVLGKRTTSETFDGELEDKVGPEHKRRRISPPQTKSSVAVPPLPQSTNNVSVSPSNDQNDTVLKVIDCISES